MNASTRYIPRMGDLVWVDFGPSVVGHEQSGQRPAIVVSLRANNYYGLSVVCPITSKIKGFDFEHPITSCGISGVVLVNQIRVIDHRMREVSYIGRSVPNFLRVRRKLLRLIGFRIL